jgi:hypothetical protein
MRTYRPLIAAAVLGLTLAGSARAQQQYSFTTIADSTTPNFHFFGFRPSINATGTVAFEVAFTTSGAGLYTGSGGALTQVAATNPPLDNFSGFGINGPSVSNAGQVAFLGKFNNTESAVLVRGPQPFTVASSGTSPWGHGTTAFNDSPVINANNQVAFFGNLNTGETGVFRFNGNGAPTSIDTIVTTGVGSQAFSQFIGAPAINAGGTVLFKGVLNSGVNGLYLGTGPGQFATVADSTATFSLFGAFPSINANGKVAFYAALANNTSAIYRYSGGTLTPIADTTGAFTAFRDPAINGSDRVAFVADLAAGGRGLFVSDGTTTSPVIQTGSALDGSTVTDLFTGPSAFNDNGQLAFYAKLANGQEGVFLATPVPEPAHLLLLGGAAAALAGRLRRRGSARGVLTADRGCRPGPPLLP